MIAAETDKIKAKVPIPSTPYKLRVSAPVNVSALVNVTVGLMPVDVLDMEVSVPEVTWVGAEVVPGVSVPVVTVVTIVQ